MFLSEYGRTLLDLVQYHINCTQKVLAKPDVLPDEVSKPEPTPPEFEGASGSWDEFFIDMSKRVVPDDTASGGTAGRKALAGKNTYVMICVSNLPSAHIFFSNQKLPVPC